MRREEGPTAGGGTATEVTSAAREVWRGPIIYDERQVGEMREEERVSERAGCRCGEGWLINNCTTLSTLCDASHPGSCVLWGRNWELGIAANTHLKGDMKPTLGVWSYTVFVTSNSGRLADDKSTNTLARCYSAAAKQALVLGPWREPRRRVPGPAGSGICDPCTAERIRIMTFNLIGHGI